MFQTDFFINLASAQHIINPEMYKVRIETEKKSVMRKDTSTFAGELSEMFEKNDIFFGKGIEKHVFHVEISAYYFVIDVQR